jgi:catechol 2,3-dioxygenase-like lactoylglutathione lyase family enzyme
VVDPSTARASRGETEDMDDAILRAIDAVTVPVPDLDSGLAFYRDRLGHRLLWRNDAAGQAGLALPEGVSELVLTTRQTYEPDEGPVRRPAHGCLGSRPDDDRWLEYP